MNETQNDQQSQAQALDLTEEINQFLKQRIMTANAEDARAALLRFKIFDAVSQATDVVCGDDESYAMTADFVFSDGEKEITSYVIAIRADAGCPLPIQMAMHQLLAIMSEYRDRSSEDQGEN